MRSMVEEAQEAGRRALGAEFPRRRAPRPPSSAVPLPRFANRVAREDSSGLAAHTVTIAFSGGVFEWSQAGISSGNASRVPACVLRASMGTSPRSIAAITVSKS